MITKRTYVVKFLNLSSQSDLFLESITKELLSNASAKQSPDDFLPRSSHKYFAGAVQSGAAMRCCLLEKPYPTMYQNVTAGKLIKM